MPTNANELWHWLWQNTTPLLVYQIAVSGFVGLSLTTAIADWLTFRQPLSFPPLPTAWERGKRGEGTFPSLSVLIPARNEEETIGACVRSLLDAGYSGNLQILVLNDRSEDSTGEIVRQIANTDAQVQLLEGTELLPGWKGKPNALRQLAEAATGEMLLLTDADCIFAPSSLNNVVRHREMVRADCLSLIPYLRCSTFWEHVIIPLQYFLVFTTLPIWLISGSRIPAFAAANGAFILIPADLYRSLGGHEEVKGEMAEDIKFAQYIKRRGYRLMYGDGSTTYAVRMYESLRGIWDGFSKNLFPAMGNNLGVLGVWIVFHLATQILPLLFVLYALATGQHTLTLLYLPLVHLSVALLIRFALSLRFRQAAWATITQPLGWCIVIAIAINSAYLALSRKGHTWKGRTYSP